MTRVHGQSRRWRAIYRWTATLCLTCALSACETLNYYGQAVKGHLTLLHNSRPIQTYIAAPDTSAALKSQLKKVMAIRQFAEQRLHLPVDNQYSHYVEIDKKHVVWNVFAAPEFSMQPLSWCFPIAGCTTYRGYFNEQQASEYANKLTSKGYDVYVAGISAYSTLGWFRDPVLSTFIHRADLQLATLLFHELAHQLLYVKGDTAFNESFATLVAQEGIKRWLAAQDNSAAYQIFLANQEKEISFVELVGKYRDKLVQLYTVELPDTKKREQKQQLLTELKIEHEQLRQSWDGVSDYQHWFSQDLNNAQLNTVATYFNWVPALQSMLEADNYDLNEFYRSCQELAKATATERKEQLTRFSVSDH